jgi:hypothetical protein
LSLAPKFLRKFPAKKGEGFENKIAQQFLPAKSNRQLLLGG